MHIRKVFYKFHFFSCCFSSWHAAVFSKHMSSIYLLHSMGCMYVHSFTLTCIQILVCTWLATTLIKFLRKVLKLNAKLSTTLRAAKIPINNCFSQPSLLLLAHYHAVLILQLSTAVAVIVFMLVLMPSFAVFVIAAVFVLCFL